MYPNINLYNMLILIWYMYSRTNVKKRFATHGPQETNSVLNDWIWSQTYLFVVFFLRHEAGFTNFRFRHIPRCSMYGIFTYIYPPKTTQM